MFSAEAKMRSSRWRSGISFAKISTIAARASSR